MRKLPKGTERWKFDSGPSCVCSLCWLLCVLSAVPTPGLAGIFSKNQPVPDWAIEANKTQTPDYAKDAPSVVLYDEYVETVDDSGRAVERHRKAVRILKPQGRKEGCDVSYDVDEKINYFRAWTIAADEKQYMAQDTDFAEVGDTSIPIMLSTEKTRVGIPPAIDVGATMVCESEEILKPYLHENHLGDSAERSRGVPGARGRPASRAARIRRPGTTSRPFPPVEVAPTTGAGK